jgi:hypothetical protein
VADALINCCPCTLYIAKADSSVGASAKAFAVLKAWCQEKIYTQTIEHEICSVTWPPRRAAEIDGTNFHYSLIFNSIMLDENTVRNHSICYNLNALKISKNSQQYQNCFQVVVYWKFMKTSLLMGRILLHLR